MNMHLRLSFQACFLGQQVIVWCPSTEQLHQALWKTENKAHCIMITEEYAPTEEYTYIKHNNFFHVSTIWPRCFDMSTNKQFFV